ncbi:hypothetical protein LTR15_006605 [Elasticomyces elasticus]|nr:hypothetical protein LTR15_006605 [Elasticomyces elasticus]
MPSDSATNQPSLLTRTVSFFIANMVCAALIGFSLFYFNLVDIEIPRSRMIATGTGCGGASILTPYVTPWIQKLVHGSAFQSLPPTEGPLAYPEEKLDSAGETEGTDGDTTAQL